MCCKKEITRKQRLYKLCRCMVGGVLACFGLMALSALGVGWVCPVRAFTGFACPGCGATRMALAVLAGDFAGALRANPFLFLGFLPMLGGGGYLARHYVMHGRVPAVKAKILLGICIAAAVLFAAVRNMPFYPYSS